MKERILEETNRVLDLPQFRFEVARKVLLHFKERLESMKKALQNQANETRTKISGKYQREYTSALNTYSDVERRFHLLKTTTLVKQGSFIIKAMRDKLVNEVRVLLLEGAIKTIDDICGFVGFSETKKDEKGEIIVVEKGLVKKLTEVEEIFKTDILGSFNHKYDFFSRQEEEHINTSLYHKELIQYYYEIDGEPISNETIFSTGKEFFAEEKMEMIMLGDYFEKYGKARIEQALEDYCQAKFTRMVKKHEVIKMLYDESTERGYTPEERVTKGVDRLRNRDISSLYDSAKWKQGVDLCLSCGACTLLCPSCYCFTIDDENDMNLSSGRRTRTQASCQLKSFTRVSGGHVFRDGREARFKHRIYHQLQYFKDRHGINLCGGCGRCIRFCPTRIDFVDMINRM